jgi:hypothetical protein
MSDITMCSKKKCDRAEYCKRKTADTSEIQSYGHFVSCMAPFYDDFLENSKWQKDCRSCPVEEFCIKDCTEDK